MSDDRDYPEPEVDKYLRYLVETDLLRAPTNREIISALQLPAGSRGLDVGCGIGTQAIMLAEAVGPAGRVIGLDIKAEFLERARAVTEEKGLSARLSFQKGDLNRLPFDDDRFDWIWSADCLGYLPLNTEIARVTRPGGRITLLFWSSEQLLPGYPLLEATLRGTSGGLAPFSFGDPPASHPLRTLTKLEALGLTERDVMTFVTTVFAPLSAEIRQAMTDILEMRWPGAMAELAGDDRELYRRLTDPESPDFILNLPDYYGFFTYSVFTGRLPLS